MSTATQHECACHPAVAAATEGPHKCAALHTSKAAASPSPLMSAHIAERTEISSKPRRDFASSLAPLGMTASDPRERP
jgi:hypothetical protein